MKKRFLVSISLFLVIVSSCKDEKKTEEKAEPVKENFSVELDVVVKKNDDFTVYYTETGTNEFDGTKAVWGGVSGGNIDEKVREHQPTN
jgi:hypothetical protein